MIGLIITHLEFQIGVCEVHQKKDIMWEIQLETMMRKTWPSGTIVYEGPPNSVPVVMQKVGSGNNRHFQEKD